MCLLCYLSREIIFKNAHKEDIPFPLYYFDKDVKITWHNLDVTIGGSWVMGTGDLYALFLQLLMNL